jgi:hypothetical protein
MVDNYDGDERRTDWSDHDNVVILKRDLRYLCRMVKEIREDVKKQSESCACRLQECNKFFVPQKVFYTALAAMMLFMGTVGTVAYNNRTRVVAHEKWSTVAQERLNDRIDGLVIPPVDSFKEPPAINVLQ